MADRRRLLVALVIDGPVAMQVDGLRKALGSGEVERIAPHVTLIPPVNVAAAAFEEVLAVVRDAAATSRPLELVLGPVSTFDPHGRVVYLTVGATGDVLAALRASLQRGPLAGRDDHRPFVAHVTVANRAAPAVRDGALVAMAAYREPVRVETLTLLEQDALAPSNPWHPVFDVALGEAPVVGRGGRELRFWTGSRLDAGTLARRDAWLGAPPAVVSWTGSPFYATAHERGATGEDALVGVVTGSVAAGVLTLEVEAVSPSARGLGVGAQLLAFVERLARERGLGELVVEVPEGGRGADFFTGRGFARREAPPGRLSLVRDLSA